MIIDSIVITIARQFGGSSVALPKLLRAVEIAEGDIVHAIKLPDPITTRSKALEITARSACHAAIDFIYADPELRAKFIDHWARIWAPVGADNDPNDLNAHWPKNVKTLWK